jgi:hypothetical protein
VGATVTVHGTNFTDASGVWFNGQSASFSVVNAGKITTTVPSGATTGTIAVQTPGGAVWSDDDFTVVAATTGTLTGTVTGSDGGGTLAGVKVYILKRVEGVWTQQGGAFVTPASGVYSFTVLADTYRVRFVEQRGNFQGEFYSDAATLAAATDVPVSGGGTSVADAELAAFGHIRGTVTNDDFVGIAGVKVYVFAQVEGVWRQQGGAVTTSASGAYVCNLLPATYRVRFVDPKGNYVGEYYDDAATLAAATSLPLAATDTVVANAILAAQK